MEQDHGGLQGSTFVAVACKECNGTGRNGFIGGYPCLCRHCDGWGRVELVYAFRIRA